MPAYAIFLREKPPHDPAEMAQYGAKNRAAPPNDKIKLLAAYGALDVLEGKAPDGVLILEFPTAQDARDWYRSPAYQDAAQHRMRGADYRVFIVEGV